MNQIRGQTTQGQNIDEPLVESRSSGMTFYDSDALGSITSLATSSATIGSTYTYDAFGKLTASTGTIVNSLRFAAREFDPETGLYYNRARYFDPSIGRFVSSDPFKFLGGINFFAYVKNNPTNLSDPFGLRDYNEQETQQQLQQAYDEATAGRIQGLRNIYYNSQGKYDFGYSIEHQNDTWMRCGKRMNADQFGNYIAGFGAAAYDEEYFWTTGASWAEMSVKLYGLKYHITGATKAKNDPFDRTGFPDINAGEKDGKNFGRNNGNCGCSGTGGGNAF